MATTDMVKARIRADITQVEIARELGISVRALAYFEAAQRPLPKERTPLDYWEAITAIKARRLQQKAS